MSEIERLLAERDSLIERNMAKPAQRNETRVWNINLRLAELTAAQRQ